MSFIVLATVPFAPIAKAAGSVGCGTSPFFPRWYDNGICVGGQIQSPNAMGTTASSTGDSIGRWVTIIALNIVQMILYAVGYISLGFIIYGGFKFMISGDSSSGTAAARKTIQNAVIGLIISIMSVAIVKLVTSVL